MELITELLELRKLCTRDEPVFCTNECPLAVDVRTMAARLSDGDFTGAFQVYRRQVLFPGIVSRICDAPCLEACIRKQVDEAVDIRALERACCDYAERRESPDYYIPPKKKLVAVIGGGLGGLGCALTLARKGYAVQLYEAGERLGGWLREPGSPVDEAVLAEELRPVVENGSITLFLNTRVDSLDTLRFDAAYVATGRDGEHFGLAAGLAPESLATTRRGVFLNGCASGRPERSVLIPLREGMRVAQSIEDYLKTGKMGGSAGNHEVVPSRLYVDLTGVQKAGRVKASGGGAYTAEEVLQEAQRCLQCSCNSCWDACELIAFFKKQPPKIIEDVIATHNVVRSMTTRVASRQVNSCNLCGLCKEICPTSLDFESIFLASRRTLHKEGNLPPAFHDFWLRDMEFSNSDQAFLVLEQRQNGNPRYLFFPGCQLGASDPRYVIETFSYLTAQLEGGVALIAGCCGAPAEWAGREEERRALMERLAQYWSELGRPEFILACPSCKKMFGQYLPDALLRSLWQILAEKDLPLSGGIGKGELVSVFDPCASRHDPASRESVRAILQKAGFQLVELPYGGEQARCCGFGGHIQAVNRPLLEEIVANRVKAGPHTYVTYCTNCRDTFAHARKPALHLLDLLLAGEDLKLRALRPSPHLSQRRENRIALKKMLLQQWKGIEMQPPPEEYAEIKVYISPELQDEMDRNLILEEDARRTIHYCEQSGNKILDQKSGDFIGHLRHGVITYWVVYRPEGDGFRLKSIYSHRLVIEEESDETS